MPRGTPLTAPQRRALAAWIEADTAAVVAAELQVSVSTLGNWSVGASAPFPGDHARLVEALAARRAKAAP